MVLRPREGRGGKWKTFGLPIHQAENSSRGMRKYPGQNILLSKGLAYSLVQASVRHLSGSEGAEAWQARAGRLCFRGRFGVRFLRQSIFHLLLSQSGACLLSHRETGKQTQGQKFSV